MSVVGPDCSDPRCAFNRSRIASLEKQLQRAVADASGYKYELEQLQIKHSQVLSRMKEETNESI